MLPIRAFLAYFALSGRRVIKIGQNAGLRKWPLLSSHGQVVHWLGHGGKVQLPEDPTAIQAEAQLQHDSSV